MSDPKKPSWGFISKHLKMKIQIYADTEQDAWSAFGSIVNPEASKFFDLETVQVDPRRVDVIDKINRCYLVSHAGD
jgi:hypothetical protein